jgi:hypothetical protein
MMLLSEWGRRRNLGSEAAGGSTLHDDGVPAVQWSSRERAGLVMLRTTAIIGLRILVQHAMPCVSQVTVDNVRPGR